MSLQKINPRTIVLLAFMLAVAIIRIVFTLDTGMSAVATFTPLGAMALFGGAYFQRNVQAYLFPLLTLFMGDVVVNRLVYYSEWTFFYEGWYFTYAAFALMVFIGRRMVKKANVKNIVVASVLATLTHWIVTSPTCFLLPNSLYAHTWEGYLASLMGAIPYERNFLVGTLAYSGILFGLFEWVKTKYTVLQSAK